MDILQMLCTYARTFCFFFHVPNDDDDDGDDDLPLPSSASIENRSLTQSCARLGASIYDVRSGWGEGGPKKQTKGTKSADS